ncbi:hypothetical protein [Chromobacterium sp. ATCC 53434]|uniref:hypothetical protein n=1 Tax=Chromobacterium sp. (strain ATCC 53434 / SC 14030) TaxID=2059672 RepID=UPI0013050C05|nr:hypothetical protein [Chromobacterium sp. ATCC 53434]
MKKISIALFSFCFVWLSFTAVLYGVARHYSPAGDEVDVKLVVFKTFIPAAIVVLVGLFSRKKK